MEHSNISCYNPYYNQIPFEKISDNELWEI
jgi:hypothetical protein